MHSPYLGSEYFDAVRLSSKRMPAKKTGAIYTALCENG